VRERVSVARRIFGAICRVNQRSFDLQKPSTLQTLLEALAADAELGPGTIRGFDVVMEGAPQIGKRARGAAMTSAGTSCVRTTSSKAALRVARDACVLAKVGSWTRRSRRGQRTPAASSSPDRPITGICAVNGSCRPKCVSVGSERQTSKLLLTKSRSPIRTGSCSRPTTRALRHQHRRGGRHRSGGKGVILRVRCRRGQQAIQPETVHRCVVRGEMRAPTAALLF